MQVIGIIPARSGSKGLLDKNIKMMNGKPLIAYSIEQALLSNKVERVIVSTDSERYAEIAKSYGADVPFLRPTELAQDDSLDIDVFLHTLKYLSEVEGCTPDIVVHLRPTHPIREYADIDAMVDLLIQHPKWDSIRSISTAPATPYKMWLQNECGELSPVANCEIFEAYNAPRQKLPQVFLQNACIDVVRASVITKCRSMTGKCIGGYFQSFDFDIDNYVDFIKAELFMEIRDKLRKGKKLTVCVDIDGLIATKVSDNDYSVALPNYEVINEVNALYQSGHKIVIFTARGSATGIDWRKITHSQLESWDVKFSELKFGKPAADLYIDDRLINIGGLSILNS